MANCDRIKCQSDTINLTAIKTAPITEQIDVSQVIENFTSTPEELTAGDVSTSASVISQLTTGAAMNATVSALAVCYIR